MKKKNYRKKNSVKFSNRGKKFFIRGKVGFGVLAVLALIGGFSFALVFGLQQLTPYDSATSTLSYTCCDSGDGDLCRPSTTKVIRDYRAEVHPQYPADYGLLKTDVVLRSTEHHIDPDKRGQTHEGNMIFYSPMGTKTAYEHPPECPEGGTGTLNPPMDPIYGPPAPGDTKPGCYLIPDDQLIYVCRPENDPGECESREGTANFDVYFRLSDYHPENPLDNGIHEVIKNCIKAPVIVTGPQSGQEIINLPSPSQQPNLQLETFYITSPPPTADWISPYCKPAIYLYPESTSFVNVRINPLGRMLVTIPEYPESGWNVTAFPSGDIFYNNKKFDYLFYEASIPDDRIVLPDEGFVVPYSDLTDFLPSLVKKLGLNEKETKQFAEYWLKVLPESRFYQIKIVEQSVLSNISPLNITPAPNLVIRVSLHFTPLEEELKLAEPKVTSPIRNGFTVVEWGGIFKKDDKYNFSCFM